MSVVPLVEARQAPLLAQPAFANGDPGPIAASLAHVPELLEVALPFIGAVLGPSSIDARTKEIVILRTSARADCRYCVETHTVVALDEGLSPDEVRALRDEAPCSKTFAAPREAALIAWVDAIAGTVGPVDSSLATSLTEHFEDHEVVELTLVVATTLMLNRYCTALQLPTSAATLARLAGEGMA